MSAPSSSPSALQALDAVLAALTELRDALPTPSPLALGDPSWDPVPLSELRDALDDLGLSADDTLLTTVQNALDAYLALRPDAMIDLEPDDATGLVSFDEVLAAVGRLRNSEQAADEMPGTM